ncbi:Eukaryotic translation initiation factor 4B [Dimargaris xerosporica]|nr:Eukaryotic translation initiation factor 4B [Dimargaris xerosporica]
MSIHEFLGGGDSSASWADEVADLPSTTPSPLTGGAGVSGATSTAKLRSMLPTHSESRNIPTEPPFSAYVGNLPFELDENLIANFFSPLEIVDIRLIRDRVTNAPKGFCIVEFATSNDLAEAIRLSGRTLGGRSIRVGVADTPKKPERESFGRDSRYGGASDTLEGVNNWRRAPLPEDSSRGPPEPSKADIEDEWRSMAPPVRSHRPPMGAGSRPDFAREPRSPRAAPAPGPADEDNDWRRSASPISGKPPMPFGREPRQPMSGPGNGSGPAPIAARKKLNLAPRTVAPGASDTAPAAAPRSASKNPFGAARPRDELEMQRRVEERRRQRADSNASKTGQPPTANPPKTDAVTTSNPSAATEPKTGESTDA